MNLLDINSLAYRRRLVRELNKQVDGFYASDSLHNVRCNRARLRFEILEVRYHSLPAWFAPVNENFTDVYGREICASRS